MSARIFHVADGDVRDELAELVHVGGSFLHDLSNGYRGAMRRRLYKYPRFSPVVNKALLYPEFQNEPLPISGIPIDARAKPATPTTAELLL